jgi:hypothetical protein
MALFSIVDFFGWFYLTKYQVTGLKLKQKNEIVLANDRTVGFS